MHIIENLYLVGGPGLTVPEDAAIYLVRFGEEAALIDAGCGYAHERLIANISACLPPETRIPWLFLTHCHFDHVGGADALRKHYGCKIVAHELDAAFLEAGDSEVCAALWYGETLAPLPVDIKISQPEHTFPVGCGIIKMLHCPGHSPGSVVYVAEIAEKKVPGREISKYYL